MKHIDRETQNWSLYQELELLPDTAHSPEVIPTFGLNRLWNGLLGLLTEELVDEQRSQFLERCLQKSPEARCLRLTLACSSGVRQFLKLIE